MTKTHSRGLPAVWRWLIWLAFAGFWAFGLITPMPGDVPFHGPLNVTFKVVLHKTVHVLAYATWAMFTGWLPVPARYRWLLMYVLMLHACLTEFLQRYVS